MRIVARCFGFIVMRFENSGFHVNENIAMIISVIFLSLSLCVYTYHILMYVFRIQYHIKCMALLIVDVVIDITLYIL